MTEKPSSATNLMYQLYIVLNNKKKANLTSVAMETMMSAAPARLHQIGNLMYREVIDIFWLKLVFRTFLKLKYQFKKKERK